MEIAGQYNNLHPPSRTVYICHLVVCDEPSDGAQQWAESTKDTNTTVVYLLVI